MVEPISHWVYYYLKASHVDVGTQLLHVVHVLSFYYQWNLKPFLQGTVHALNITICDIMSFFLTINQKAGYSRDLGDTITQYLLNYLQEENYDSSYTLPVLQVIDRLMANNCQDNGISLFFINIWYVNGKLFTIMIDFVLSISVNIYLYGLELFDALIY